MRDGYCAYENQFRPHTCAIAKDRLIRRGGFWHFCTSTGPQGVNRSDCAHDRKQGDGNVGQSNSPVRIVGGNQEIAEAFKWSTGCDGIELHTYDVRYEVEQGAE